jgi:cyclopropane-fatty-acyl-phospholipid synthase
VLGEREQTEPIKPAAGGGVATQVARLLGHLSPGPLHELPVRVRFWDGSELPSAVAEPPGTLVVKSRLALAYVLHEPNELGLSRAWAAGTIDMEGDLEAVLGARTRFSKLSLTAHDRAHILATVLRLGGPRVLVPAPRIAAEAHPPGHQHSLGRDRAAVQHHYELPADFYRLLLGPTMVYSCAYFDSPQDTLEAAQEHKLELICRKLALRPGDRLLDVGCGWGSLIVHAAAKHGVHALGITLSPTQAEVANRRAREAGVAEQCEARVADYRELHENEFDAIASVGMYEHVGRDELENYTHTITDLLRPGGTFMNHGITRLHAGVRDDKTLIARFVFPDGALHPLRDVISAIEGAGLEVRDVESLREHYTLTLRHWSRNLAAHDDEALALVGAERARIWRLYMAGSASAFALGDISVYQTLSVKAGRPHRLPLNRLRLISD